MKLLTYSVIQDLIKQSLLRKAYLMQVREIYELSKWFLSEVQRQNLQQSLEQCVGHIKKLGQPNVNAHAALSSSRENLYAAIKSIDCSSLTSNHRKCLKHLGISFIASENVIQDFDRLFELLTYDVTHTLSTFELYSQQLKVAVNRHYFKNLLALALLR